MTRIGYVLATYAAALSFGASILITPSPKLIWNASSSVPIGLYAVRPARPLSVGELVVIQPPKALAAFLDERRYLPRGVPLLKHVLALPGQSVCRSGRTLSVDGKTVGEALDRDHAGRLLPVWQGCRRVADDEVFLMNERSKDSLDGRYFGLLPIRAIIGRAAPLWTHEGG